jgi:sugar phosphate isomerase/epimerase
MPDTARLSFNLATTRERWGLIEAVEGCARHGVRAIAPWRDQIQAVGVETAARVIRDHGLAVTGLCRGGMFPAADAENRRKAIEDNLRAIDEARAIDSLCLVLVCGGLPPGSRDIVGARGMVRDGIGALLDHARAAGVPLAIEPLHPMYAADRNCVNTLGHALDLCDELGEGVGVAIDVYHVWWDPKIEEEIARCKKEQILAFHICDWLVPTRDLLLDRGMMGDGVIDIPRYRRMVEDRGFEGFHEVEIFSAENWWKRDPEEVLRTCIERHRTLC